MLHANELMIGDWVLAHRSVNPYSDGAPYSEWNQAGQIQKIEYGYVDVKFIEYPDAPTDEERCVVEDFNQKEIESIPLTPEILEKNGFSRTQYYGELLIQEWHIQSDCKGLRAMSIKGWYLHIQCEYVHELQHALRLCGIKKEIVL